MRYETKDVTDLDVQPGACLRASFLSFYHVGTTKHAQPLRSDMHRQRSFFEKPKPELFLPRSHAITRLEPAPLGHFDYLAIGKRDTEPSVAGL
jgi:hypothetical protein